MKTATHDVSKLWRVSSAARELGLLRSTVFAALDRGEIPCVETACGIALIEIRDLREWSKQDRKRGPRPS